MNKIDLYFRNNLIPEAQVAETKEGGICLTMEAEDGRQNRHFFTKTEASYIASALRMVLGQEKVLERTP